MKSSTIEKNNTSTKMNGPISPVRDGQTDADRTEQMNRRQGWIMRHVHTRKKRRSAEEDCANQVLKSKSFPSFHGLHSEPVAYQSVWLKTSTMRRGGCPPETGFSAVPSHDSHRFWERGRVWSTDRSTRHCAASAVRTSHLFPVGRYKGYWRSAAPIQDI